MLIHRLYEFLIIAVLLAWGIPAIHADMHMQWDISDDLKEILDAHASELYGLQQVCEFSWLPGYFVKPADAGYNRLQGAEIFDRVIKKYNLKIRIPKKYKYQAPNGSHYVIATKAHPSGSLITLGELKELVYLALAIRWMDCAPRNFMKTADGYITIIDTEPRFKYRWGHRLRRAQRKALIYFLLAHQLELFTPEAANYIRAKVAKRMQKLTGYA